MLSASRSIPLLLLNLVAFAAETAPGSKGIVPHSAPVRNLPAGSQS